MSEDRKARAKAWFEELRDQLCAAFEALEDEAPAGLYPGEPGRFVRTPWRRGDGAADHGGGVAGDDAGAVLRESRRPRLHRPRRRSARSSQSRSTARPTIRASGRRGISLIAHMRNPHCPAAHMNTRHIVTTRWWFGGGGDLNPTQAYQRDRIIRRTRRRFMRRFATPATPHGADLYPRYKKWADEYFWLPHRNEPRGVGGIFYDHHNSGGIGILGDDFAFTQDVGRAFLAAYPAILAQTHARAVERSRSRRTTGAARPLCRVQPALRSRHDVRAEDRRQCREHPLQHAAGGEVALSYAAARVSCFVRCVSIHAANDLA